MQAPSRMLLVLWFFFLANSNVLAETYPSRTIKIVVPLAAGTGMDVVTRLYAEPLSKALNTSIVIENQPGAALMLAARNVAKAPPDGYTLLVSAASAMAANPALSKNATYEPEKDFVPISVYLDTPFVLIVNATSELDTLKTFVSRAQERVSAPLTVATSGIGGLPHLAIEMLKRDHQLALNHVPYKSSGQIVTDVLGGHVNAAVSEIGNVLPLINGGRLRALAITSSDRYFRLPETPTFAGEIGPQSFDVTAWHGLFAPSATPAVIVEKLIAGMNEITRGEAFQRRVAEIGLSPRSPLGRDEMRNFLILERARWAKMIQGLHKEASR